MKINLAVFTMRTKCPMIAPSLNAKRHGAKNVDRYNQEKIAVGVKQLTTGYRKLTERYFSACSNLNNYQYEVNRMIKWNVLI